MGHHCPYRTKTDLIFITGHIRLCVKSETHIPLLPLGLRGAICMKAPDVHPGLWVVLFLRRVFLHDAEVFLGDFLGGAVGVFGVDFVGHFGLGAFDDFLHGHFLDAGVGLVLDHVAGEDAALLVVLGLGLLFLDAVGGDRLAGVAAAGDAGAAAAAAELLVLALLELALPAVVLELALALTLSLALAVGGLLGLLHGLAVLLH